MFALPLAAGTFAAIAGTAAALIVGAYILKMRRRRFEVPFSLLWQRVLQQKETSSLWRRLRRLLSLLLVLSIGGAMLLATVDPTLGGEDPDALNVVVIIDASASMKATDGADGETRISAAKNAARDVLGRLGAGDSAMVLRMDGQSTPLSRFNTDHDKLGAIIDGIKANDTPADLRRALRGASDALRGRQHPTIVLVGDGAYPDSVLDDILVEGEVSPLRALSTIDLRGIDIRYFPVGLAIENVGVVAFNVRRYIAKKASYEVFVEVKNFGDKVAKRKLTVWNGDSPVEVRTIDLLPGKTVQASYANLSGGDTGKLRAELEPVAGQTGDLFPLDDRAYALLPRRKLQRVLLVTPNNLYIEGALLIYENIEVDKFTPNEYDAATDQALAEYDTIVFDGHTPKRVPSNSDRLYFNPQGKYSPFPIRRTLSGPRITDIAERHPVMRWLTLSDVNIETSSVFKVDRLQGETALFGSVRAPLAAARLSKGQRTVAIGFDLASTDLTLRVAFPLLVVNALDWFGGDDTDLVTTYRVGERLRIPIETIVPTQVTVTPPTGNSMRALVAEGIAHFYAAEVGIHRVKAIDQNGSSIHLNIVANLADSEESTIRPREQLTVGGAQLERPDTATRATRSRSLWHYLVMLAGALLLIEWVTFNRRITI